MGPMKKVASFETSAIHNLTFSIYSDKGILGDVPYANQFSLENWPNFFNIGVKVWQNGIYISLHSTLSLICVKLKHVSTFQSSNFALKYLTSRAIGRFRLKKPYLIPRFWVRIGVTKST